MIPIAAGRAACYPAPGIREVSTGPDPPSRIVHPPGGGMSNRARRPREARPTGPGGRDQETLAARIHRDATDLARAIAAGEGFRPDAADPDLSVALPVTVHLGAAAETDAGRDAFLAEARRRVLDAVRGVGTFRLGRVYCFQCRRPDCEHSAPADPAEVFCGYTTGGRPVFKGLANLLIERGDPRVEALYATPPVVTALVLTERELSGESLSGFSRDDFAYRVRGEVVCGLLPAPLGGPGDARSALTVQVVETRGPGPGRRLRLNVLGVRPDDLADAMSRAGREAEPARALARMSAAARHRLDSLGRHARDLERRGFPDGLDEGVRPVLTHLRADLERLFRATSRRTRHAEERHASRVRPTGQAVRDALDAPAERVLLDTRRDTVVVLGPRGRTHVFTRDGRHVTSLVLTTVEVERRAARDRWKTLDPKEVAQWRARLSR